MPQDREKKRISDRKYAASEKGKLRTKRYLEKHRPELLRQREELKQRKLEAFCRWYNVDVHIIRWLIGLRDNGVDIEERDPHNAKYVRMWESRSKAEKKKEEKQASVGSLDYN